MRTFQQISALRAFVRNSREDGKSVGFVPTMGALHEGHLALIRRARSDSDVVVISVFVNPTQFGPGEDFARYPRDLSRDSRLAQEAGVDALFAPGPDELYPAGFQTKVLVPGLAERWEGQVRPGHFEGVATVCAKLFAIVQPDRAYFGQKDYQQLKVVERLAEDLNLPVVVVPVPTVRESDGLAMSSRNAFLEPAARAAAAVLWKALEAASAAYAAGERATERLEELMAATLAAEPAAAPDYAVVVDAETLEPTPRITGRAVALVAARVGPTRLIDNVLLGGAAPRRGPATTMAKN